MKSKTTPCCARTGGVVSAQWRRIGAPTPEEGHERRRATPRRVGRHTDVTPPAALAVDHRWRAGRAPCPGARRMDRHRTFVHLLQRRSRGIHPEALEEGLDL